MALANGSIRLPGTLAADAADLIGRLPRQGQRGHRQPAPGSPLLTTSLPDTGQPAAGQIQVLDLNGVVPPVRSARFGIGGRPDPQQAAGIAAAVADSLVASAAPGDRLLVLATEEFMALPLAAAARLQELRPDLDVRYSTAHAPRSRPWTSQAMPSARPWLSRAATTHPTDPGRGSRTTSRTPADGSTPWWSWRNPGPRPPR